MIGAASSERESASFSKSQRLLSAGDYSRVFDGVQFKASHKHLLLLAISNDQAQHRLGLVIAKKNVRLAVNRNRIKRVAREFFRRLPPANSSGNNNLDVVLLTRRGIDQLENQELFSILQLQWKKLEKQLNRLILTSDQAS